MTEIFVIIGMLFVGGLCLGTGLVADNKFVRSAALTSSAVFYIWAIIKVISKVT